MLSKLLSAEAPSGIFVAPSIVCPRYCTLRSPCARWSGPDAYATASDWVRSQGVALAGDGVRALWRGDRHRADDLRASAT